MLTKEISNDVHIKSSPKLNMCQQNMYCSLKRVAAVLQTAGRTIAGQAFSLNETILATHTILLRLATDILSAHLSPVIVIIPN